MKKWICFLLALALLIPGAALAANFGLKPQRPDPKDKAAPPKPTEAPADIDTAPAADAKIDDLGEIDLSAYSDAELNDLANRVLAELDARQSSAYGMAIEDGLLLIDRDGLRLALFEMNYSDEYEPILHCEVLVENNTGKAISISILDPKIDGTEVDGIGVYGLADGETASDYFYIRLLEGIGDADLLENGEVLTFSFEVWEDRSYETMFEVPVTLP